MDAQRPRLRRVNALLAAALLLPAGCADLSYRRIQLGDPLARYEHLLPAATTRRTPYGLAHLGHALGGRTEVVLVLWTNDRRVAGKVYACHFEQNWGWLRRSGFLLQGQIDPQLYDVAGTGPFDTLRMLATDLAEYRGETLAVDAHAWVVAGLMRLLQRWPGVREPDLLADRVSELYEKVPGGGETHLWIDRNGIYHFEYQQDKRP